MPPAFEKLCSKLGSDSSYDKNNLRNVKNRLSQDLLSHATVRNRTDGLFFVKVIWESGIDLARLVECLYLFRRERHVEAPNIILHLPHPSPPPDRAHPHPPPPHPRQRHSPPPAPRLPRHPFHRPHHSPAPLLP